MQFSRFLVAINEITTTHVWCNHMTCLKYGVLWRSLNSTSRRTLLAALFVSNMEWPVTCEITVPVLMCVM
jgi:hypothetical protein